MYIYIYIYTLYKGRRLFTCICVCTNCDWFLCLHLFVSLCVCVCVCSYVLATTFHKTQLNPINPKLFLSVWSPGCAGSSESGSEPSV